MKIVVDKNIPYIAGLLEPYAQVVYADGAAIDAAMVRDADALVVRTRTRCDESLLGGSRCRLVATATIGMDHIDTAWCAANGVAVENAPGCNAPAVAQYVLASILSLGDVADDAVIGIVGVGHVGRIVDMWARSLGYTTLLCDPPRALAEGAEGFVALDEIARRADVVTFHTPLTKSGEHTTFHLADADFFASVERTPLIINSARGGVVDESALLDAIDAGRVKGAVVDCWEGEPNLNLRLLEKAAIATPHIAGYSQQGKLRATHMALDALSRHLGLPHIAMSQESVMTVPERVSRDEIISGYDPAVDTAALRADPSRFERLRNNYKYR